MVREIGRSARPLHRGAARPSRLPAAAGEGGPEVAPQPDDARAPRPLAPRTRCLTGRETHERSTPWMASRRRCLTPGREPSLGRAGRPWCGATLGAWPRRPLSRADSSCRSSSGCRASARSTRSPSRRAPAELAKRSIKKDAKVWALELALRCCDLTTLEGQDTPGKVAALCSKADAPRPERPEHPVRRRGLRLPEPRRDGEGAPARQRREGRERRDGVPVGPERRSTSRCATSRTRSRSAPTRSTW